MASASSVDSSSELERCIALREEAANMLRRVELMTARVEAALDAAKQEVEVVWNEAGRLFRKVTNV